MLYYILIFFLLFDLFFQKENETILYVTFPVYFLPKSIYSFSLDSPKGKIISNYYSEIYTTLNINEQNYPLFIRPQKEGPIELTSKNYKSDITNIYNISALYNKEINEYDELSTNHFNDKTCKSASPYFNDYKKYCSHKEDINFQVVFEKNNIVINKTLDLKIIIEKEENIPGIFGIKFPSKDDPDSSGIINYLKNNGLINQYLWYFIKINNEYKLIFGSFPHEIFNDLYDENDLKSTENFINRNIGNGYKLKFDKINIVNENKENELLCTISELIWDVNIIIGPTELEKYLNDTFLKEEVENSNCFTENFSQKLHYITNYHSYYCKLSLKNKLINKFGKIKFEHKKLEKTFILDENDLYYQDNEYIYINVYFFDSNLNITYWQLGRIFTMKYQFLYNTDSHLIYCYQKYKSKEAENKTDKYLVLKIIGILILAGILVFFGIIIGKNLKKRKKRANELKDDEYEYKIDDNYNKKLINY